MKRLLPVALMGLLLAACTGQNRETVAVAPSHDMALIGFVAAKKVLARQLELQGALVEARREWRYVSAADPKDEEARARIAQITRMIDERKAEYLREGEAALDKGQTRQAQAAFLKLLALDPSDETVVDRLRKLDRAVALVNQGKKNEKALADHRATLVRVQDTTEEFEAKVNEPLKKGDYRKVIDISDQFLKRNPSSRSAAAHRRSAYLGLVDQSRARSNYRDAMTYLETLLELSGDADRPAIEEKARVVRGELAAQLYSRGLAVMSSNLPQSIELLDESVRLNPDNPRAVQSLNQARKMQENLARIGGKPK